MSFNMPPRTSVLASYQMPISPEALRRLFDGEALDVEFSMDECVVESYQCIDCGFKTAEQETILEHQRNQASYHTTWQRLKRWVTTRREVWFTGPPQP